MENKFPLSNIHHFHPQPTGVNEIEAICQLGTTIVLFAIFHKMEDPVGVTEATLTTIKNVGPITTGLHHKNLAAAPGQ